MFVLLTRTWKPLADIVLLCEPPCGDEPSCDETPSDVAPLGNILRITIYLIGL